MRQFIARGLLLLLMVVSGCAKSEYGPLHTEIVEVKGSFTFGQQGNFRYIVDFSDGSRETVAQEGNTFPVVGEKWEVEWFQKRYNDGTFYKACRFIRRIDK